MDDQKMLIAQALINNLMVQYESQVPEVKQISELLVAKGIVSGISEIKNDHLAFRTFGLPHMGIESLEKPFLRFGYTSKDRFDFPIKKLNARWYAPPNSSLPAIFISELRVTDFSDAFIKLVEKYVSSIREDPFDRICWDNPAEIFAAFEFSPWETPSFEDFATLNQESEYGAWVLAHGAAVNHFTIAVHNLKEGYNTIADFNPFLERHGFVLNDAGGKIKISRDGYLKQSSLIAQSCEKYFFDDNGLLVQKKVPGCYVEFAERLVVPQKSSAPTANGRRAGFDPQSADKIFESTYEHQVKKGLDTVSQ